MVQMTEDRIYEIADLIELAMDTRPVSFGWTPSAMGRKVKVTTHEAREVLDWMTDHVFVTADYRGAWTRYYRRY
jgi:hypothetical protein